MGLPCLPARILDETDTFEKSSAIVMEDPFTEDQRTLIPAAFSDVSFIHATKAGNYGNAVIEGIVVENPELSAATKLLIVTTEEIVDTDEIRENPIVGCRTRRD